MHAPPLQTPEGREHLIACLENERAAIHHFEHLLRQDPDGFDQLDTLLEHCHRYRNLATILKLSDALPHTCP